MSRQRIIHAVKPRSTILESISSDYLIMRFHHNSGDKFVDYISRINGNPSSGRIDSNNYLYGTLAACYSTPGYFEPVNGENDMITVKDGLFDPLLNTLTGGNLLMLVRWHATTFPDSSSNYVFNYDDNNNNGSSFARISSGVGNLQLKFNHADGTTVTLVKSPLSDYLNKDNTALYFMDRGTKTIYVGVNGDFSGAASSSYTTDFGNSRRGVSWFGQIDASGNNTPLFNGSTGSDVKVSDFILLRGDGLSLSKVADLFAEYHETPTEYLWAMEGL